ncbi:MAG: TerC family protein [Sphingobacteriia bacterium]|nr:TerC family protein [Sphingobacteriia bacterium]
MEKSLLVWIVFLSVVLIMLILDLGLLNKKGTIPSVKKSIWISFFYIFIGFSFSFWIWNQMGLIAAKEYLTGFIIEKTLSLDNVFVISVIFTFFNIPSKYQHRVLFWGILGVIILRAIMIGIGAVVIKQYQWIMYIFSVFLIYTGIKMFNSGAYQPDIKNNLLYKLVSKYFRVTHELHEEKFLVRLPINGEKTALYLTPLMLSLIMIEFVDLIFAVDSVPAIFAITNDPYIVYTSNIFAILGLRSLYFALDAIITKFKYLKHALSIVLIFIGSKIFINDIFNIDKFPPHISLLVTLTLIIGGIIYSVVKTKNEELK